MYNGEKIGVGVVTCNRKVNCGKILSFLRTVYYIDCITLVKNREYDYGEVVEDLDERTRYFNIKEDLGVGYCKNVIFKNLMSRGCDHIFTIEDDTIIKDGDVFKKYIDTARHFNMEHLVFGYGSGGSALHEFNEEAAKPICTLGYDGMKIDFYHHIQGAFCYYTRNSLEMIGLMDAKNYINAVEHIEHTYRLIKAGYYSMFWAFADINDSTKYLGHDHSGAEYATTIDRDNDLYKQRVDHAYRHFFDVYHIGFGQMPFPSKEDIQSFMIKRLNGDD